VTGIGPSAREKWQEGTVLAFERWILAVFLYSKEVPGMYIYRAVKKDNRYTPPKETVLEFSTQEETISWLQRNGGGWYRCILDNVECWIPGKALIDD